MVRKMDPNVKLPRAVANMVIAGEQTFNETYPDPLRQAAGLDGQDGADAGSLPLHTVPEQEGTDSADPPPPVIGGGGEDQSAAEPPPPLADEPKDIQAQLATLQQAHRSLQGKYNAEGEDNRNRIAELTGMVRMLTEQVNARPPAPPAPPQPDPLDTLDEKFEPELVDYVKQRINRAVAGLTDKLATADLTIKSLQAQLQGVQKNTQATAAQTFETLLDREIPGWRQQNGNDEFIAWLKTAHPDTGDPWKNILDNAARSADLARVVRVFRAFPGNTLAQAQPPEAPAPNPPRRDTRRRLDLDTLAVPPRGRQTAIGQPQLEQTITTADLQRFTADKARGRYRNDPAAAAAIEAAIDKAITEGRFVSQPRH